MGFSRARARGCSVRKAAQRELWSAGACAAGACGGRRSGSPARRAAWRGYVVCARARSRMAMRSLSASMQQAHKNTEMAVAVNTPL